MTKKVVGYIRVSTAEQANSGLGLKAQETAIRGECAQRGWDLVDIYRDEGKSGSSRDRPGLNSAFRFMSEGAASGLVVAKLDRLTRSLLDFLTFIDWFDQSGATFVALDLAIDTSTPAGRLVANVLASVAEWERGVIAARTQDGLAARRAEGKPISPPAVNDDPQLSGTIRKMREKGMTLQAIADDLNDRGLPTLRGGTKWRVSSVQAATGYRRRRKTGSMQLPRPRGGA